MEKALKDTSSCRLGNFDNYGEMESDNLAHPSNSSADNWPKTNLSKEGDFADYYSLKRRNSSPVATSSSVRAKFIFQKPQGTVQEVYPSGFVE